MDVPAAAPGALRVLGLGVSLTLAANRVQGGVGAADEVEAVAHDPGVGQRGPDRLAVGVARVDRDDLDPRPDIIWQRRQQALDDLALTAGQHLDHAPAIEIRDDRGQLAATAVVRLI